MIDVKQECANAEGARHPRVHMAPIVCGYTVALCRTFFIDPEKSEAMGAYQVYIKTLEAGTAAVIGTQYELKYPGAFGPGIQNAAATNKYFWYALLLVAF